MKKLALIIGAAGLIYASSCSAGNKEKTEQNITAQENVATDGQQPENEVVKIENKLPTVLDFYADWCGPCKRLAPVLESIEKDYKGRVEFRRINVDNNVELSSKYGIQSIPTLVYLDSDGQEVTRTVGLIDASEIEKAIDLIIKK